MSKRTALTCAARGCDGCLVCEPARPKLDQEVAEFLEAASKDAPDCGDNSCRFAAKRGGMRTNGGCRCMDKRSMVNWSPVERYAARLTRAPDLLRRQARVIGVLREALLANALTVREDGREHPMALRAEEALAQADAIASGVDDE